MTVDDIIAKARYRLADYDDEAYTDEMFIEYINDGAKEFALSGCCQERGAKTSGQILGGFGYAFTNLTYRPLNIYAVRVNNLPLPFSPAYEVQYWPTTTAATVPTTWTIRGEAIIFDHTWTTSTTKPLYIYYTYIPNDVTAVGNDSPLADKWAPALVSYCVYRCREADRDDAVAMRAYAEFEAMRQTAAKLYDSLLMRGGYG